jgi:F0F1-type ATP synthase membrane subunit c/vacuolar-type H+-ATPase subunit K
MLAAVQEAAQPAAGGGFDTLGVGIGIGLAPEAANDIRGTSLLIAFLMEGATIIAVIMALVAKIL